MTCTHDLLVFNGVYKFGAIGNCDRCGSPQRVDNLLIIYKGDYGDLHFFEVMTPFSCPGCHTVIDRYNLMCGKLEITKELDNIKK